MQLICSNSDVQKIIIEPKKIQKKIGLEMAKTLIKRINQLESTDNFNEYITQVRLGKPHALSENLDGYYGIYISKNYRLVVEPICESLDLESLKECRKLDIKGVLEYHDGKNEWIIP